MLNIDERGSASIELVPLVIFFLCFITALYKFSILSVTAASMNVTLQNRTERFMIDNNRPACLENLGTGVVEDAAGKSVFGGGVLKKVLAYRNGPYCKGS